MPVPVSMGVSVRVRVRVIVRGMMGMGMGMRVRVRVRVRVGRMRRQRQQGPSQLLGRTGDGRGHGERRGLRGQVHALSVEGRDEVEGAELLLEVAGQLAGREQQRMLVQPPLVACFEGLEPVLHEALQERLRRGDEMR